MKRPKRSEHGRLEISDDELAQHAMGILVAASLPQEMLMRWLGCEPHEADAFQDDAWADLSRLRMAGKMRH